jgi:hypothetical protein
MAASFERLAGEPERPPVFDGHPCELQILACARGGALAAR